MELAYSVGALVILWLLYGYLRYRRLYLSKEIAESALVKIRLLFEGTAGFADYVVTESHIKRLLAASIRLHYDLGSNPHSNQKTAVLRVVYLYRQVQDGPVYTSNDFKPSGYYWWATPDLMKNGDPNGAAIFEKLPANVIWGNERMLWKV